MEFTVKLDRYEGPYTKLLELIEQRKLSITEISLVSVSDDYIAYIKTLEQKNLVDISQFIVVASTLILMKAKSLLPGVVYTEEEEKQVHDLEEKLALYALLSSLSSKIRERYNVSVLHTREHASFKNVSVFVPDSRIDQNMLHSIAELTLATFITPKALVKVAVEQALRIENVIESLLDRVNKVQSVTLQSLAGDAKNITEQKKILIVNFIALLELLRQGGVYAEQYDGGDITIRK
ncbi:MAG: segregation/condensation protein A [Candidatus Pacebacteria bacterium]|nr:segregation/condensation protein A [Candidatus Paceibacterota bacterium]MBP9867175.1 segregation/condensation protein A [Candidatus Paceibacterota bacterium]